MSPERITRRQFLKQVGEVGKNVSAFYAGSKLEPYLHFLESKEQEPDLFYYGFATEEIPARLAPSFSAEKIKYFGIYKPGTLLRYQLAGTHEETSWAKIAHDKRWARYRAIGYEEIYVPLGLVEPLTSEMLTPIHPEVEPEVTEVKRVEISLKDQKLTAYEGEIPVLETLVSTGTRYYPTVKGTHRIFTVRLARRMAGADWDLPGVPFVMYFHWNGQAIHGTYWHENFGQPMSHGCVNLPTEKAAWLFRWVNPQMENPFSQDEVRLSWGSDEWKRATRVIIY